MKYSDFIGEVQHRLELDSQGAAVRATRVVLTTLGERLGEGEADDLASPLPQEIGRFLREAESEQRFSYPEFVERVAERAGVEEADAAYYAQAIVELVAESEPGTEIEQVRDQLPEEFEPLFEFVGAEATPW
ncbi:DUF2267 domain-containing protein [Haloplanus sp. GCM10025708]|uniref:DUF2267 domain-containing protein n=1 Tax=Haloferacaceae TaxID=1644056 RepID=UPI00361D40F0